MPVYFKRTDAKLGRLIAVCTVIAAVFFLGGGDVLPAFVFAIAGGFLFIQSDPQQSALRDFGVKLIYFVLIALGIGLYHGFN
ncbi:hypothetical protein [Saliphagus infecundisoli]|uniref:Phosphatidate cytidylyltransferase n=1 Tax=Saliphagus infecundisoli TaxID=1849069 RepID=A0ABD5QHR2_9EURY|nr:hypothetical protein [Saliphagus infecundisoli]